MNNNTDPSSSSHRLGTLGTILLVIFIIIIIAVIIYAIYHYSYRRKGVKQVTHHYYSGGTGVNSSPTGATRVTHHTDISDPPVSQASTVAP